MCSQDVPLSTDSTSLTGTLNRGGLILLNDKTTEFFVILERNFRQFTTCGQKNLGTFHFEQFCSKDQELTQKFEACIHQHSTCKSEDINEQERLLSDIQNYFYRIRIHHACKSVMERSKSAAGPKKGLRKSLKKLDGPISGQDL